jgi:DNA-binding NarL/FixJ family response regulator
MLQSIRKVRVTDDPNLVHFGIAQPIGRLLPSATLLPLVVISGSEDAELAPRAIELGVLGFVPKSADR